MTGKSNCRCTRQAERPAIRIDAVTLAAQVGLGLDPWQEEVLRSAAS